MSEAELTLAIRRILSEPKILSISYSTDVPAAKGYASAKISTELVDSATSSIVAVIDSHIQQEIAKARIDENEMYMQEAGRHYFPAGPNDPYIPLVQFHERIGELTLKEHKEKQ